MNLVPVGLVGGIRREIAALAGFLTRPRHWCRIRVSVWGTGRWAYTNVCQRRRS